MKLSVVRVFEYKTKEQVQIEQEAVGKQLDVPDSYFY